MNELLALAKANNDVGCCVPDCRSAIKVKSLSFCVKHYKRFKRSGSPFTTKISPPGMARAVTALGYIRVFRSKLEHAVLAEKALGKPLPKGALVHHWNEIKTDNRPENLLVCPSDAYHLLIHMRPRALEACGNPNWLKCRICKKYDDASNLVIYSISKKKRAPQSYACHRLCNNERARNYARRISENRRVMS